MSEGDRGMDLMTTELLDCNMEQMTDDGSLDPEFRAFLEDQLVRSPARASTPFDDTNFGTSTPLSQSIFHDPIPGPHFPTPGIQCGLLHSPGTAHLRKRKYGLLDHGEFARSLPSRLYQASADYFHNPLQSPVTNLPGGGAQIVQGPIRTCKVKGGSLTSSKQSSPGLGSTMPFSLVKKYPSSDCLSLDDINSRIQNLAKNPDSIRTPTNSNTSNSTQLNHTSPSTVSRKGSRKRL